MPSHPLHGGRALALLTCLHLSPALGAPHGDDAAGPPLTLRALIAEVLERNPRAHEAEASVEVSRSSALAAGAFEDPMLSYALAPLSLAPGAHRFGQTARLSQRLPFPGKRGAEIEIAEARTRASLAERRLTREQLALTAAMRFTELYALHHALDVHQTHRLLLEELRVSAEARYRAGLARQDELLEAQLAIAELDADEALHLGMRHATRAELNGLLRRAPSTPLPAPQVDVELAETTEDGRMTASGRPELAAIEAERTRAEAETRRVARDAFPDVELMAEYSSMWDMPEHRFMVGLGLAIPLQLGRRAAEREATRAEERRASHALEAESDRAAAELAAARARHEASKARARLQRDRTLPLARARVTAARASFLTGQAPLAAALEAERALRTQEIAFHTALADVALREAELRFARGDLSELQETSR